MKTTLILLLGLTLCGCNKPNVKEESLNEMVTKQELLEASVSDLELAKQGLLELTIYEATNRVSVYVHSCPDPKLGISCSVIHQ
jgi:hypothetical protein